MRRSLHSLNPRSSRPRTKISSRLEKNLFAYATAASAAGVSLLALVPPAPAEIVATPANAKIAARSTYLIDPNHDGIADFGLERCQCASSHSSMLLTVVEVPGNALVKVTGLTNQSPIPLHPNSSIGPSRQFTSATTYGGAFMAAAGQYGSTWFNGPWAGVTDRYLGLKFIIAGEVHYGWARLSVTNYYGGAGGEVLLTAYAYETTPNTEIRAGKVSGPDPEESAADQATPPTEAAPASLLRALGALARGSSVMPLRREAE
jgi:hypothetical protein